MTTRLPDRALNPPPAPSPFTAGDLRAHEQGDCAGIVRPALAHRYPSCPVCVSERRDEEDSA